MPTALQSYRVFIASPGGLARERKAFREVIEELNETWAIRQGFLLRAVGWEAATGGARRAQEIINEEVRTCDFFFMLLYDKWGTPPGGTSGYTSGTEEEFYEATACHKAGTMREMLLLFKSVPPKQMADPGGELQKVIAFREKIEAERNHFFKHFDSVEKFKKELRAHLFDWLLREPGPGNTPPMLTGPSIPPTGLAPASPDALPTPIQQLPGEADELIAAAWQLANDGKLTEAETLFARAIYVGQSVSALLAYGTFLVRQGLLERARAMFEDVQTIAEKHNDQPTLSAAYSNRGIILAIRGDLDGAEDMYHKSLAIVEKLGQFEGMASDYCNLGNILKTRGDLDGAEAMFRKSLAIDEKLEHLEGIASDYGNLGVVLAIRGNQDEAEAMYRKSLTINEKLENLEGMAIDYGNLGIVLQTRGDLDGAEAMYRQSLAINEKLGRLEGMAINYGNLGVVLKTCGDLNGAETMYRQSLATDEKLGQLEGMAIDYINLGSVFETRGDLNGAEAMFHKALEAAQKLGVSRLIDECENCLEVLLAAKPQ